MFLSKKGMILNDALLCLCIVVCTVLVVFATENLQTNNATIIKRVSSELNQDYETKLYQIKECEICIEEDEEENTDEEVLFLLQP